MRWPAMSKALQSQSVLVVDDEPLVRMLTVQVLEEAGFKVEEAAQAQDALNHIDGHSIAVLVTDIHMPGEMDGRSLAWRATPCALMRRCLSSRGYQSPRLRSYLPEADFLLS